jgi:hypothetical protein
MRKVSSRAGRVRWLRTGAAALAIATLAGWVVALTGTPASAARAGELCTSSKPPAGCHFILVSSWGGPSYDVKATLYNGRGKVVYRWSTATVGGRVIWWYIAGTDGGSLDVSVNHGESKITGKSIDRDYCFSVDDFGSSVYTGDSKTGHCTPK